MLYSRTYMATKHGRYADIQELGSVFFLGDGPNDSPYARYIFPLTDSALPVRYAIAASALCHLSGRLCDHNLEQKSLYLRVRATSLLRVGLGDPGLYTNLETLASILMLTQLDVSIVPCGVQVANYRLTTGTRCALANAPSSRHT